MTKSIDIRSKLLSHRLRGFSKIEHTFSALKKACQKPIPFFEIDTRVSRDGEIYVYHNPFAGNDVERSFHFLNSDSSFINGIRYVNGENVATLKEMLGYFGKYSDRTTRLVIDVKDYGFEKYYLDLVRQYDLEARVNFISWIPQSLIELSRLGAKTPFILSHVNLMFLGELGKAINYLLKDTLWSFSRFVVMGKNRISSNLGDLSHGFKYAFICTEIPDILLSILSSSGGGICISLASARKKVYNYCHHKNLLLSVYSDFKIKTFDMYIKYALNPNIDIIFCDNAPIVIQKLLNMHPP